MIEYTGQQVITLCVNGATHTATVWPSDILLDVLRAQLGLTGAKPGCLNGDCGACTVLMDGLPVKSCLVLAVEAVGHAITTVEGLRDAPVQKAFVDHSAFQCGYCTSGFLLVCHALTQLHPDADEYTLESWLASNLCRCTSLFEIRAAMETLLPRAKLPTTIVHQKEEEPQHESV